jgi:hypothetical protein
VGEGRKERAFVNGGVLFWVSDERRDFELGDRDEGDIGT